MEITSPTVPGTPSNDVASTEFPTIEPERLIEHLAAVCQIALGATREELEQAGNLLHKSRYTDTVARCSRFATDTQNVLYIQKDIAASTVVENGSDIAGGILNTLPCSLSFRSF
jgi:dynein heavy chain 1